MRRSRWFFAAAFLSLSLALATVFFLKMEAPSVFARGPDPFKFRVEVTHDGFNGQEDEVEFEVRQGEIVELTFVWADDADPENTHLIELEEYDLKTGILDKDHRESTLRFIAERAGEFEFRCILFFEGYQNLVGHLRVIARDPNMVAPTALSLTSPVSESEGDAVPLSAVLTDGNMMPIPNATIRFFAAVDSGAAQGDMEVGSAVTDARGAVAFPYIPTFTGTHLITARFEGLGLYQASEGSFTLEVTAAQPAYTEEPTGLGPLRKWAPVGFVAIVFGVWATFGYVLYNVWRIVRAGR